MANLDAIRPTNRRPNFLKPQIVQPQSRKTKRWKWFFIILVLILLAGGLFYTGRTIFQTNKIFAGKGNIFTRVGQLIVSPDKKLIGEDQGTVNILLMGIGGEGHDGAYLTDTMIVASINTNTSEVVLTSIPRDFMVSIPKRGNNKINAVYAYALQDNPNDPNAAGIAAIAATEKITGFNIPYYALVDFKGFVKAVDHVGGVDVTVDRTFTDSSFPNDFPFDTKGYLAPVKFTKGPQHMDGRTALIFARSRHSDNPIEGSDFARSERQKKILTALKDKVKNLGLTDLGAINNLLTDFTNSFRTNLEPYELKRLADLGVKISNDKVYSLSLEPQDDLICSRIVDLATGKPIPPTQPTPPATTPKTDSTTTTPTPDTTTTPAVTGAYVVMPCAGKTTADIQAFLTNYLVLARLKKEAAVVEIQTSTGKPIPPAKFQKLIDMGINVRYVQFKGKVPYTQTILYDNSGGQKPNTLNYLNTNYSFTTSDINYTSSPGADFIIILGKDSL